ncbi:unnamed protein product [Pleuronectes platessa]|uniref:Uncharacterized protein n=1 Tax=Pleuronectes platessa TaxID=8262 RepID=A0A9N7UBN9_PLEPL|nr:unnamed protein product [Pleuronectes platessa]
MQFVYLQQRVHSPQPECERESERECERECERESFLASSLPVNQSFDLSAAFDPVNQQILISSLQDLGVSGSVSEPCPLTTGVPQETSGTTAWILGAQGSSGDKDTSCSIEDKLQSL